MGDRLGLVGPNMAAHPGVAMLQDLVRTSTPTSPSPSSTHNPGNGRHSLGSKSGITELAWATERDVGELGEKEEMTEKFSLPFSPEGHPQGGRRALIDILCGSSCGAEAGTESSRGQEEQFPPLPPPSGSWQPPMFSPWSPEGQTAAERETGENETGNQGLEKKGENFSSPLSPLRRLINPAVEFMKGLTGRKGLGKASSPQKPGNLRSSRSNKVIKAQKGLKRKKALALARSRATENLASLERGFCAESARKAKASKVNTVVKLMVESKGSQRIWPLTVASLKSLAMALQGAGYKSGYAYLSEAKLLHVERGHEWDLTLDRCYKQCIRSLKRLSKLPKSPR